MAYFAVLAAYFYFNLGTNRRDLPSEKNFPCYLLIDFPFAYRYNLYTGELAFHHARE